MIGIISDVHGNYPALEAVLKELDAAQCDKIISLGDVCGYYCMVNECIDTFRERNIINLMGNHDKYIADHESCPRSFTVNLCLDYQRKILTEDRIKWLRTSPMYLKYQNIWMVHGGWKNYIDEYLTDFSFLDEESETKLYISGHTHVQKMVKGLQSVYFNPGSVGQPRDHKNTAAYAILDGTNVILKRTPYDIDRIDYEMKKAGFDGRVTECLYYGCKIGEKHE